MELIFQPERQRAARHQMYGYEMMKSTYGEIFNGKETGSAEGCTLSNEVFKETLPEKVTFEQRSRGAEGVSMWQSGVKCVLESGHSECKGPGVAACGTLFKEPQEGQCGIEYLMGQLLIREKGDGIGWGVGHALAGSFGDFCFYSKQRRKFFEGFEQRRSGMILPSLFFFFF